MRVVRIGSRGSPLALWQADFVGGWLERTYNLRPEIVRIRTTGDRFDAPSITSMGLKGVFIKELEEALLGGRVDIAVHSLKDVPTTHPAGLTFPAITRREDPRDCLIAPRGQTLSQLPAGARIGTSSLRRQAQLLRARPDVVPSDIRGNVETRLRKLDSGEYDAIVLARAGIERLRFQQRVTETFEPDMMLPAVGQGALAVEMRAADCELAELLAGLDHRDTRCAVEAERALLAELEGGCQVPLGAWGRLAAGSAGKQLVLDACVCSADGKELIRDTLCGPAEEPQALGRALAQRLRDVGADAILRLAGRTVGSR